MTRRPAERSSPSSALSKRNSSRALSALNALTLAISQSLDLDSILKEGVRSTAELFDFDASRIYLFNESRDELHLKGFFEARAGTHSKPTTIRTGEGLTAQVAKSGEPAVFENIQTDPHYSRLSTRGRAKKSGTRFLAAIPIKSKLRSWGVLECIGRNPRRLDVEDLDLLILLSSQIAIAIENAKLFQQTAEKAKELSALYSIAAVCAQFLDINLLLHQSMRKVLEIFGFTAGRIYIVDRNENEIRQVAHAGFPADFISPRSYRRKEGLVGMVVETGEPLAFADMQNDPEYHRLAQAKVMMKAGFHASLFIPLKVRGECLGVMNLVSRDPYPFSPSDIQLIKSIAYHLGTAIGNANLFSQLRQKTADLEKANTIKDEFLNVMSHELRTPLNVIMGYTQLMKQEMFGSINGGVQNAVAKITAQTQALVAMIDGILITTTIEAGTLERSVSAVRLKEFFDEQTLSYDVPAERNLRLIWDIPVDLPVIKTDCEKLKLILQSLIDNAIKFTVAGSVTVSAGHLPEAKTVELKVSDTGIGIERDKIPHIFELFHQLDSSVSRSYGGMGLGLYVVKKLTEFLGGTVEVESEPGKGSTFTVVLPLEI